MPERTCSARVAEHAHEYGHEHDGECAHAHVHAAHANHADADADPDGVAPEEPRTDYYGYDGDAAHGGGAHERVQHAGAGDAHGVGDGDGAGEAPGGAEVEAHRKAQPLEAGGQVGARQWASLLQVSYKLITKRIILYRIRLKDALVVSLSIVWHCWNSNNVVPTIHMMNFTCNAIGKFR